MQWVECKHCGGNPTDFVDVMKDGRIVLYCADCGFPIEGTLNESEADVGAQADATSAVNVHVKKLHEDAVVPAYAHETDAGFDLHALVDVIIEPRETKVIRTGIAMQVDSPDKYEIQIRPRSGISSRTKLRVANAPGTIDKNYTGEIGIIIDNTSVKYSAASSFVSDIKGESVKFNGEYPVGSYLIRKGEKIAQGVLKRVETAKFKVVAELEDTDRGEGGFGSTGV